MRLKTNILVAALLTLFTSLPSQNPAWITYNSSNSGLPDNYVRTVAIDPDGNKWLGTYTTGLIRFDGNNWTLYDTSNSGLQGTWIHDLDTDTEGYIWISVAKSWGEGPIEGMGLAKFDGDTIWQIYNDLNSDSPSDDIIAITTDGNNNVWIGTTSGLARFDGTNWTVYDTSNSDLPENIVESIAIDSSGNVWAGLRETGLVKFDGVNWTLYNVLNSDLPDNDVNCITINSDGVVLVGTDDGYAEYDGSNWIVYHFISNSNFLLEHINSIAVEMGMIRWIGTSGGLVKLLWTSWTVFDSANSGLPSDYINSIAIDEYSNKWITSLGLIVFNEGGVVGIMSNQPQILPEEYTLSQNHPNPFNPTTTIQYELLRQSDVQITIYDLLGREIKKLVSGELVSGYHEAIWDGTNDHGKPVSAGVYLYQMRTKNHIQTKKLVLLK
ncbi:MAG: two-component regulator propeller domain-containing protein [Fidelibacterota bacterium]